ncbi:XRE family transcriptional regulator [Viridibacillus sp. FSL R5-0468]|uniref:LexA family protein n=1 Tax=Viridibacillus sp. FSL R5-0468 TaxID=2921640 RepID=UPI0030F73C87
MNVGDRLKKVRNIRNLRLAEVAEMVDKTEATIQRYESGNIKNLKLDIIESLAEIYRVSPAYLMGWESESPITFSHEYTYYPVSVAAGLPNSIDCVLENEIEKIILPDEMMGKWAGANDVFILKANGESMNKFISNGSLIAVKCTPLNEFKNGDIVVFSYDNDYSVKRFINDKVNSRFIFRPESTDEVFSDYIVTYDNADSLKIHGKVILYITVFD